MLVQGPSLLGLDLTGREKLLDRSLLGHALDADQHLTKSQVAPVEVPKVGPAVHRKRALDDLLVFGEEPDEGYEFPDPPKPSARPSFVPNSSRSSLVGLISPRAAKSSGDRKV